MYMGHLHLAVQTCQPAGSGCQSDLQSAQSDVIAKQGSISSNLLQERCQNCCANAWLVSIQVFKGLKLKLSGKEAGQCWRSSTIAEAQANACLIKAQGSGHMSGHMSAPAGCMTQVLVCGSRSVAAVAATTSTTAEQGTCTVSITVHTKGFTCNYSMTRAWEVCIYQPAQADGKM